MYHWTYTFWMVQVAMLTHEIKDLKEELENLRIRLLKPKIQHPHPINKDNGHPKLLLR